MTRVRDPARRERILTSAATLIAERGYHPVTMADIGAAAGIVGSGIYRHFESKNAVLGALADRVMERLLAEAAAAVEHAADPAEALAALVAGQIDFVLDERPLLVVYLREQLTLREADRRRSRRMQRQYIERWVDLLVRLRPELTEVAARVAVHAAIGAIQASLHFESGLPRDQLTRRLAEAAHAVLGLAVRPPERAEPGGLPAQRRGEQPGQ